MLSSSEFLKRLSFILNSGVNEAKIFTMMILECLSKLFTQDDLYIFHYILNIFDNKKFIVPSIHSKDQSGGISVLRDAILNSGQPLLAQEATQYIQKYIPASKLQKRTNMDIAILRWLKQILL